MPHELPFHRFSTLSPNAFNFTPRNLIVAGWTGRDHRTLEQHLRELEALGVKRPSTTPVYYRVAAANLTQDRRVQVLSPHTSGEIEPVLLSMRDGLWLGIGSDHTDRKIESLSVAASKQACPKIVGGTLWDCRDIAGHCDDLILRSWIAEQPGAQPVLYQEGSLAMIRPLDKLIEGHTGVNAFEVGSVLFCGTFPAIGGVRPAVSFSGEIEDPVLKRKLRFTYDIEVLPVID